MKKSLFTAGALALMALASCSNDETIQNDLVNNDLINFRVITSNASRANSLYKAGDLPESFVIDAIYNADQKAYFTGDVVNLEGGAYKAVNSRYWPSTALDFYAYTKPEGVTVGYDQTSNALKYTDVTIPENAKNQDDLLYAVTKNQLKTTQSGKVQLNFRHALAQLAFKVKNESKGLYVDVQGVSLVNISNSGSATASTNTTGQYKDGGTYSSQITWNPASINGSHPTSYFDLTFANKVAAEYGEAVDINVDKTIDGVMYIIPQAVNPLTLDAKTSVNDIYSMYFLVNCRIINVADTENGVNFADDTYLYGTKTASKNVLIPVAALANGSTKWEAGKKYVYTFIFGRDGGNGGYDPENPDPEDPILSTITYDTTVITVDDWTNTTETEVNMSTK